MPDALQLARWIVAVVAKSARRIRGGRSSVSRGLPTSHFCTGRPIDESGQYDHVGDEHYDGSVRTG